MIDTSCDIRKLRIALSEPDLANGYFWMHGIEPPTNINFKNFVALVPQSHGGQARHGYPNVTLTWANPSATTLYNLRQFIDQSNNLIFLTIPYNDGSVEGRQYIDIRGIPIPVSGQETGIYGSPGIAFSSIQLKINNLTVITNPATF